eukprot:SAG31_NODE_1722_length_7452_cov_2.771658_11_plen_136_part_00
MRAPTDPVEMTANGLCSSVTRNAAGEIYKRSRYMDATANQLSGREGQGLWTPTRIDIGTSFGGGWQHKQGGKEAFLKHSAGTHVLFASLFDGLTNPVRVLYDCCARLLAKTQHKVVVAAEGDGKEYGVLLPPLLM